MKNLFKKLMIFGLSCALSVGCLVGCKAEKKTPVSIELWYYLSGKLGDTFDKYITDFNNTVGQTENIVIEGKGKGSVGELSKELIASANNDPLSDKMPTMFASYADTAYTVNQKKPLANLDPYFTKAELDEYMDGYISEGRIDSENLKVFPIAKATETIILDIDRWNEFETGYNAANPQKKVSLSDFETDEKIRIVSEKYYEYSEGRALFSRDGTDNYFLTGSAQLGEELYTIDSSGKIKINFTKPVAKTLWDNYYIPYVQGYYSHLGKFGTDGIKSGETMASVGSTSASANYPDGINLKILPAPIANAGAKKIYTQQGAGLCVVDSDKRTVEACATFLKWFTEEGRNIEFSIKTGYLPVKKAANDYKKIGQYIKPDTKDHTIQTIKTAIDMINSSEKMYTSKPAVNSNAIRNIFKNDFSKKCKDDFAELKKLQDATEYANVLNQKMSEQYFNEWYDSTNELLQKIANGRLL